MTSAVRTGLIGAGIAGVAGAVVMAVTRARANGDARPRDARTIPPAPVEEGAAVFMTENGILCAEPEFGRNDFFS
jgi:hypothetical protein